MQFPFEQEVGGGRGLAGLQLSGSADGQQVLIAVVRAVQVIAALRIPEIDLDAGRPENFAIPCRGSAVERANRDFYFLGEVTPVDNAVIAALKYKRISVLNAVCKNRPLMRVIRAVEICAIARRKETARPDVELGRRFDAGHGVQHADLVVAAIVFGIKHEFDFVGCRPVHVETSAIEQELIRGCAGIRFGMDEAGLQSTPDRHWRECHLRM